ncbi:acyl-CoA-binding domain-containing protein 5A [Centropristis striata]|uniref:acyl-CoA-binding domain-containing protein 5A n=1 Tax=Centropristis striata TaxID=184440 RepID=UPI0027E14B52|nr:acyl-CoA-binding domain-containing protein 5A [Centropristis striata]XP_059183192.1 acyl-CoA-binding domain-containing protein 5A [Centropristis striata]
MELEAVSVEDERRLTVLRFEAAVKVIKSLPPDGPFQPSNDMMLKFYSYYKQATVGVCDIPRPGFWDAVGKAKWDAWNSLGDMSKEDAMAAYVDEMKLILEGMPMTDEVEELLRVLGPFYELIDEKKKITEISDLGTGFGTVLNSMSSKTMVKSIVRNMEMNGTLETRPARLKPKEVKEKPEEETQEEDEDEEDEEEEEEEEDEEEEEEAVIREVRKDKKSAALQPKKKGSARRHKAPISNGKLANGGTHLTNGSHTRAALNSANSQEGSVGEPVLNGHHTDLSVDMSGPGHVASDSDSEVYCDSVDQFGQEGSSEHNRSLDDLDEEENHVLPTLEEPQATQELQDDVHGAPQGVRCGGEDGENGGTRTQRQRLNADMPDSSLVRRGRGSRSPGRGSGALMPTHGAGDGDGDRWGGAGTPAGSLNEQIVVALARLQEDMQSVLERLHTLEALTASQARAMSLSPTYASTPVNKRSQKPSWWPFDISPTSLAFAVIWPFVVQWLIRLYLQRRRRRIN